jgi:hypothetical protein
MKGSKLRALDAKVAAAGAALFSAPDAQAAFVEGVKWAARNLDERELGAMAVRDDIEAVRRG